MKEKAIEIMMELLRSETIDTMAELKWETSCRMVGYFFDSKAYDVFEAVIDATLDNKVQKEILQQHLE